MGGDLIVNEAALLSENKPPKKQKQFTLNDYSSRMMRLLFGLLFE